MGYGDEGVLFGWVVLYVWGLMAGDIVAAVSLVGKGEKTVKLLYLRIGLLDPRRRLSEGRDSFLPSFSSSPAPFPTDSVLPFLRNLLVSITRRCRKD